LDIARYCAVAICSMQVTHDKKSVDDLLQEPNDDSWTLFLK
jgi:hypothetical protein